VTEGRALRSPLLFQAPFTTFQKGDWVMTDKVTMKALDTFHASNVRADNLQEGDVFLVSETDAKALEQRGLAVRGGKASDAVNPEADSAARADTREELDAERGFEEGKAIGAAPTNKMANPPANKAAPKSAAAKGKKAK
jgi:hypothetical protein